MTQLPHYPADPAWSQTHFSERTIYESKLVRACELRDFDVIKWQGAWTSVLDVYADSDAVAVAEQQWNDCKWNGVQTYVDFVSNAIDFAIDTWVAVRLHDVKKSTASEIEDTMVKIGYNDLVEVQVPVATQEG